MTCAPHQLLVQQPVFSRRLVFRRLDRLDRVLQGHAMDLGPRGASLFGVMKQVQFLTMLRTSYYGHVFYRCQFLLHVSVLQVCDNI